jgi:hypothetical protein
MTDLDERAPYACTIDFEFWTFAGTMTVSAILLTGTGDTFSVCGDITIRDKPSGGS